MIQKPMRHRALSATMNYDADGEGAVPGPGRNRKAAGGAVQGEGHGANACDTITDDATGVAP